MYAQPNSLRFLVARVRRGDTQAAAELSRTLESQLVHMVRHILRTRRNDSSLAERVFAEDRELSHDDEAVVQDEQWRVGVIARRICASFVGGLQMEFAGCPGVGSTVRN
jgi:hypothetical protein